MMTKRENIIDPKFMAERIRDWTMMRKAKQEYEKLVEGTEYGSIEDFVHYMDVNYGVRPVINRASVDGPPHHAEYISGDYDIINEQRHMMFVLKFR